MTKEALLQELTTSLTEALPPEAFAVCPSGPENGHLGLDIPYVWVYPWGSNDLDCGWTTTVVLANEYAPEKAPVMAYMKGGIWFFVLPVTMADPRLEKGVPAAVRYSYKNTIEAWIYGFTAIVQLYQVLRDGRADAAEEIEAVLGGGDGLVV